MSSSSILWMPSQRNKGFVWIATSQFFMGAWQQAGNVLRIKPARPWLCEIKHMWEGSSAEEQVMKEMRDEDGKVKMITQSYQSMST